MMNSVGTPWLWGSFAAVIVVMLAIDLLLQGRKGAHNMSMKQAASWSLVWVSLSLLFNFGFWYYLNETAGRAVADTQALAFLTGYLIEKALAVDNVFVWLMLFSYFAVPANLQRREGERFFVRRNGILFATPLVLVLILVELSDVIFAVDSIPAIFAVTTDPFIVLTSNLFAIMGLRAMYFLLANVAERFSMLKYGLSVILVFIGIKMLIIDFFHIPIGVSLGVVAGILTLTLLINAWVNRRNDRLANKQP